MTICMGRRQLITLASGAAAALPFAARAQQAGKLPTIGVLGASTAATQSQMVAAFTQRLRELGWIDGRNVTIEYRWARGDYARLPALAAELVQQRVNVLVATGGDASALAAKAATATIPVVFNMTSDPVKAGLVEKSGAWFSYDSIRIGQGRENSKTWLKENPEMAAKLEAAIRANTAGVAEALMADPTSDDEL